MSFGRKFHTRINLQSDEFDIPLPIEDKKGMFFTSNCVVNDGINDLSKVHVLHSGLDTVRQLYKLTMPIEFIDMMEDFYENHNGEIVFPFKGDDFYSNVSVPDDLSSLWINHDMFPDDILMDCRGIPFIIGSGGRSGYRWRLQNNELGITYFFGSRYADLSDFASHCKIELSPSFIHKKECRMIQSAMDSHIKSIDADFEYAGIAVHICADIQGWNMPSDFEHRLSTRSRRISRHVGVEKLEFEGDGACIIYGNRETITFGRVNSLQYSVYRKDIEILKHDKIHYWHEIWEEIINEDGEIVFNPDKPVWRHEFRFHHSVIKQLGDEVNGNKKDVDEWLSLCDIEPHLTDIFQYGLKTFRLDQNRTYVDPLWQLFFEDIEIRVPCIAHIVRRAYKKPGIGSAKNIQLYLGNFLTLAARNNFSPSKAVTLLKFGGLYHEIEGHFNGRGVDVFSYISEALSLRRLRGAA